MIAPFRRAALALLLAVSGCAASEPEEARAPLSPSGPPVRFSYVTLKGEPLSSESLRGRTTLVGLVATYDVASQAQAKFLAGIQRDHVPRLNVALLIFEPPGNRLLAETFVETLKLPFPAALVDAATMAGRGPFPGLHHVPSVVILDAEGRERWRHVGLAKPGLIESELRRLESQPR